MSATVYVDASNRRDDSKSKDHSNSWNSRNFNDRNNISKTAEAAETPVRAKHSPTKL